MSDNTINCGASASQLYAPVPAGQARPLRVGVMLNQLDDFAWIQRVLTDVRDSGFASVVLAVVNDSDKPEKKGRLMRFMNGEMNLGKELYWRYSLLDERVNKQRHDAFRVVDLRPALGNADIVPVQPISRKFVHRFTDDDVARIKSYDLDVMIRFGFNIIRGDILDIARHGVWSYHHGDNNEYRGGPALFWEIYEGNPLSGTILQVLTDELDGGKVIYRSFAATIDSIWLSNNREETYWKTTAFVIRCLRQLHRASGGLPSEAKLADYKRKIYRQPANREMSSFLVRAAGRVLRGKWRNLSGFNQWLIGYRTDRSKFLANSTTADLRGFTPIVPPKKRSFADPFVFSHDGRDYVFIEDLDEVTGRGRIAVMTIGEDGKPTAPEPVLERDYHLSYPFLFEWQGDVYMLPETAATRSLQLFRATKFPYEWELHSEPMRGYPMVDATLHEQDGCWYMFVNVSERGGSLDDELFLFIAETPLGPWQPHPLNPIKSDVRSARPAGRLFKRDGKLIRPAQDCSTSYGSAINLCEVEVLTETDYRERIVERLEPNWRPGLEGCHTLSFSDRMEFIDGKRTVLKL